MDEAVATDRSVPSEQNLPTPGPLDQMQEKLRAANLSPGPLVPGTLPPRLIGTTGKTYIDGDTFSLDFDLGCCGPDGSRRGTVSFGRSSPDAMDEALHTAQSRGSTPKVEKVGNQQVYYLCGHICGYVWAHDGLTYQAFGIYYGKPAAAVRKDLRALIAAATPLRD